MARDLLFELGVEELPSAYMAKTIKDFEYLAQKKFAQARLNYNELKVYGTPRRLTLFITALEEMQEDAVIENRGPKKAIAFDKEGNPSPAAQGFARGQGVRVADLLVKEVDGIEYIFAVKNEISRPAEDIIAEVVKEIVNSLVFPKSMRWAYYQTRFARPIRWLLLLFGDQVIDLQMENVKSDRFTRGHRFLSKGVIQIQHVKQYFQALRDNYVILDQDERKAMIWNQVQEVAQAQGGKAMENPELLEEITYLLEYPHAFYGQFSNSYLEVPPEVLTTSMIAHQRYFPVYDTAGQLLAGFIGVRNGTDYSLDIVRAGNERVIKARLEDALFFWKEDTKKPLSDMTASLSDVLFHERLGSIMDKVDRIADLACYIGQQTSLSNGLQLVRSAYLCKADLVSSMVYEFPELQGIMGRYYAKKSGEDAQVCQAVFEHYLPRFAGDELPETPTGIVLSLSEKIDNLIGCYAIGIKPSGSQDPYALRRQAMGIVNIIMNKNLNFNLYDVLSKAYAGFSSINPEQSMEDTVKEVMDFIFQRMRGVLGEKNIPYDVIDAVFMPTVLDIADIYKRALSLQQFKTRPEFDDLMVVFNRSHNLSKKWQSVEVQSENLIDTSEIKLYEQLQKVREQVQTAVHIGQYDLALENIASLRKQIDIFFEAVMVMVDDELLKNARLGLLKSIADLCRYIADFSKIVL